MGKPPTNLVLTPEPPTPAVMGTGIVHQRPAPIPLPPPLPQKTHIHTSGDWMVYDANGGWAPQPVDIYNNQIGKNIVAISLDSTNGRILIIDGGLVVDTQLLHAWDQKFAKALIMAMLYTKMNISLTVSQELKLVEALKYIWGYKGWP